MANHVTLWRVLHLFCILAHIGMSVTGVVIFVINANDRLFGDRDPHELRVIYPWTTVAIVSFFFFFFFFRAYCTQMELSLPPWICTYVCIYACTNKKNFFFVIGWFWHRFQHRCFRLLTASYYRRATYAPREDEFYRAKSASRRELSNSVDYDLRRHNSRGHRRSIHN